MGLNPLKNGAVFRPKRETGLRLHDRLNPLKNGAVFRLGGRGCVGLTSGLNPLKNGAVFRPGWALLHKEMARVSIP